jgi:hypothetical protein
MREHEIVADEDLFSLYKIGHFIIVIKPSVVEPGAGHLSRPATDHAVVVGEVLVFAVDLPGMALDDFGVPALRQLVDEQHVEHVLVPPVLDVSVGLVEMLGACEGQVSMVAKVEVVFEEVVFHEGQYFLVFGLVNGVVQELVLEGEELD